MAIIERPCVLILRALGLGDFLTGIPALRGIQAAFSESRCLLAAPEALGDLLPLAGLDMDLVHTEVLGPISDVDLRTGVAVNLHGSGPESHRALLALRPRQLIAFHNSEVGNEGPSWDESEHEVGRWCRLLSANAIDADASNLSIEPPVEPPPAEAENAVLIHPGAKAPARRWPIERWARVASHMAEKGDRVIITGSAAERQDCQELAWRAGIEPDSVWAGRTDLRMLTVLIAAASTVLSGDTGVAHLATALRIPSVVLFGPTPPTQWGPPSSGPHQVLWKGTTGNPHASVTDPGLLAITPAEVIAAAQSVRS